MKKIIIFILSFSFLIISNSSSDNQFLVNLVPGDGYTEASIQINEDDNPDLEILAVRDIDSTEYSNFLLNLVFILRKLIHQIDLLQM